MGERAGPTTGGEVRWLFANFKTFCRKLRVRRTTETRQLLLKYEVLLWYQRWRRESPHWLVIVRIGRVRIGSSIQLRNFDSSALNDVSESHVGVARDTDTVRWFQYASIRVDEDV